MVKLPEIVPKKTGMDKFIDITAGCLILLIFFFTLDIYSALPDKIPVHFNVFGEPDRFGSRFMIFLLPTIGALLYTGFVILNRFPHLFNYPAHITPENAENVYTFSTRFLRLINFLTVILFALLQWFVIQSIYDPTIGSRIIIIVIGYCVAVFSGVIFYFIKLKKITRIKERL